MTTTPRTVTRSRPSRGWPTVEAHYTHTVSEANEIEEERRSKRFRKAMALNDDHFHFTDEERYDLARMLVGVDTETGGSWKALDSNQLHDLITMMEGYAFINWMLMNRQNSTVDGTVVTGEEDGQSSTS